MNGFESVLLVADIEILDVSLDKFVKYANHLSVEFAMTTELTKGSTRGEKYVIELIDACYKNKILSEEERDDFHSGEINIEEIVLRLLEILIEEGYFVVDDYGLHDSTNPISFVYAWNTYMRLGKSLGKGLIEIPDIYSDTSKPERVIAPTLSQEQIATGEKIDSVLSDDEEYDDYTDLEESNFLSLLQNSADILCNLEIREGDLYDFDCFELIAEATCYDILTPDEAQEMIDMLEKDESKSKVQVIFQIFQKFYDNDFVNTLDIAEDDRKILKSTTSNYLYALNMLASTGTFN